MAEVTCPQCQTRQPISEDAHGYRCVVCAASWSFVRCTVCGERFHTRPRTRAWTCPTCGTPHGRNRRGMSKTGAPIALMIGAVLAVGGVVAAAQLLGGDGTTPSPPPSARAIRDPAQKVCSDLVDVQVFRVEALGRATRELGTDADALRSQGEPERATVVDEVVAAIVAYQGVAEGGGDPQEASNDLLDALKAVDWC